MLVAAELTLAGIPALKVPDNWSGYDVIAQPQRMPPQRVSVKGRTYRKGGSYFADYNEGTEQFGWIAIVLLPSADLTERRIYVIPRDVFDTVAKAWLDRRSGRVQRYVTLAHIEALFALFRNNFSLKTASELAAASGAPGDAVEPVMRPSDGF